MWGCQTRITLSTPPVAMMFALEQYSKAFTPLGIPTPRISLKCVQFLNWHSSGDTINIEWQVSDSFKNFTRHHLSCWLHPEQTRLCCLVNKMRSTVVLESTSPACGHKRTVKHFSLCPTSNSEKLMEIVAFSPSPPSRHGLASFVLVWN